MNTRKIAAYAGGSILLLAVGASMGGADTSVLDEQVTALEVEVDASEQALADAQSAVVAAEKKQTDAEKARDAAIAESEALREQYDPAIKAERQAAVDAEAARACEEAKTDYVTPVSMIVDYDTDWESIMSKDDLVGAVEACAAEVRNKSAEEREAERLAACGEIDVDAVVKDPDSYVGQCFVIHAAIWQWDSRTGTCGFMAAMDNRSHDRRYEYDEDGLFQAADPCPMLDGIDNDDFVKVWATGAGGLKYDTAAGGTNEVPMWVIEKVELVRKG